MRNKRRSICKMVTLARTDSDFNTALNYVDMTLGKAQVAVLKIERVQSPLLYNLYCTKKSTRIENSRQSTAGIKRILFHGTSKAAVEKIIVRGFNTSFSCQNNCFYGRGTYFSTHFSYASIKPYSVPDNNGIRRVLICKVLTGFYTLGKRKLIEPRMKNRAKQRHFDSVVDNSACPKQFVVFEDHQAYPEFVVSFCR